MRATADVSAVPNGPAGSSPAYLERICLQEGSEVNALSSSGALYFLSSWVNASSSVFPCDSICFPRDWTRRPKSDRPMLVGSAFAWVLVASDVSQETSAPQILPAHSVGVAEAALCPEPAPLPEPPLPQPAATTARTTARAMTIPARLTPAP